MDPSYKDFLEPSPWMPGDGPFTDLVRSYAGKYDPDTMMALPEEHAYVHWLVREKYTGRAGLVELGCFLGSMTRSLLAGLGENTAIPAERQRLAVYDRFLWFPAMKQWVEKDAGDAYPEIGDSYRYLFERKFEPVMDRLEIHEVDFSDTVIDPPEVEILIIDVMKGFDIAENVAKSFFPKVIPGGVLFNQDYLHYVHGWIPLLTWHLRDHLKLAWLHPNPDVCTVVFEVTRSIPAEKCVTLTDCFSMNPRIPRNPKEILEAFSWNRGLFPADKEPLLLASEIFLLAMTGYADPFARERLELADSRGWLEQTVFRDLLGRVSRMTWKNNWFGKYVSEKS